MLKQKFQRKNRLKLLFQHLLLGENKFSLAGKFIFTVA